ncbi:MAG: glutamine--tRNA ligase/YqeY domain fusion protein [Bacteroidaceae bacterium]|nr:glutamine--tRNA ligase/YqeY domain fusion protein [Bacteroidaceae bacterium]MBQ9293835.1 glutamine--tRNA ligase/YqeY domain fusion protein [Bacteroidaceae bacterium]
MAENVNSNAEEKKSLNFIEQRVEKDLAEGKNGGRLQTRFPPEPNGYLHIGHAKAIALDFGIAERFGGVCNLRMDDTNPQKEDTEYVEAIERDIKWLGFHWGKVCYASDYFQDLWDFAEWCIMQGRAYVDEQTSEEIAAQKGTPTEAGTNSPYRDRPAEESLRLFREMNSGNVEPGKMILRAKIDMASPNMHFRDPIMYRVLNMEHWRTGKKWNAYPMYDFTHGQSDYLEGVTHSICTLEFVPHHELYDLFVTWIKEWRGDKGDIEDNRPRQFEFNKLNLNYTLMSKRNLLILTKEGIVNGWDDPRMPTICGIRRRGYSPQAILNFIDKIGYTTFDALNDIKLMEAACREDLNTRATRVSAVVNPVRLIIDNYPEGKVEEMQAINNPELRDTEGNTIMEGNTHTIRFSRELYIERDDFMEDGGKKFLRLGPGKEVRLKNAYIIACSDEQDEQGNYKCIEKDSQGNITCIHATYDAESRSGLPGADRKIKGKTLHWVSCQHSIPCEVRNYECLWTCENPRDAIKQYEKETGVRGIDAMRPFLNPESLTVNRNAVIEEFAATMPALSYLQFQRIGYFNVDTDSTPEHLVFNKTVGLKDTNIYKK